MTKIYLSGPMTGYPESNYPAFQKATNELRDAGHIVYSPHEFMPAGKPTVDQLRKAFAAYCKFICEEAEAIVLLPGWENSLGVSAELALAKNCQLEIIFYTGN
ncbi:hypothetical protein P106B_20 [Rhizobium phage vB_RglS_P106B]|uniref:Nucleoside 2-deoxyribosyltransferase n=1 Tax=Rhizobium phage vB_RglS_P106B TaxID=1458697 RepID=W6E9N4_9CAUD|nr:nucleoside 2-deoxyribosyltransferase [Rhizobium phage vB_RglS_P106B]AHJ10703.1 hypothetical protein P106B_20 [Rhizobium phage vB_RglS_P106B]